MNFSATVFMVGKKAMSYHTGNQTAEIKRGIPYDFNFFSTFTQLCPAGVSGPYCRSASQSGIQQIRAL